MSKRVIIGPPGTGKTTRLIGRIDKDSGMPVSGIVAELLREGYAPDQIAFVSYSRAAIREAVDRVEMVTGIDSKEFSAFRTLHSTWTRELGAKNFMKDTHWSDFKKEAGYDVTPHDEEFDDGYNPQAGDTDGDIMLSAWDWCRAAMEPLEAAQAKLGQFLNVQDLRKFVEKYEAYKQSARKMDHGDIIVQAHARRLTLRQSVILVDEAQDLSPLQVATLLPSIEGAEKVWVVGDDDQAIYQFQGASPRWLMSLWSTIGWDREVLGQSFRCPEPVRRAAATVVASCRTRVPKEYAPRDGEGHYETGVDWREAMIEMRKSPKTYILARSGKFCGKAAIRLFDEDIPYIAERGRGPNPLAKVKLMHAIDTVRKLAKGQAVPRTDLAEAVSMIPSDTQGGKGNGWVAWGAKTRIENRTIPMIYPSEYAEIGISGLAKAAQADPWKPFEERNKPRRDGRSELIWLRRWWEKHGEWPKTTITIMTWHASKGREADLVVVDPSMPRPCYKELIGPDGDSEHRCAYVAVTRARRKCLIVQRDAEAYAAYPFPRSQ